MQLIETAPHEFAAHFLFEECGLEPFFACDRRVKDGGGSQNAKFKRDDETWKVTLSYRDSGLQHPGRQLPSGTEFVVRGGHARSEIPNGEGPLQEGGEFRSPLSRYERDEIVRRNGVALPRLKRPD